MNRRHGATDGTGRARDASPHRIPNQAVFAGASNLRPAFTMTNRNCIHVR